MKKKQTILLALTTVMFASCASDSSEIVKSPPEPIMLGTAMQVETRGNSQTLQATELEAGQTVGVYIYYTGETEKTGTYGYENIAYTVSGTAGDLALVNSAHQPYYPEQKNQNVDVYAFAPRVYTGTAALNTLTAQDVFTTASDQTTNANYLASDFVWGKTATAVTYATATAGAIEIPLKHKLSKVNINIAPGTGMTLDKLAHARITLHGVVLQGTVDFTTGTVTTKTGAAASTVVLTSEASTTTTTSFSTGTPAVSYTACTSSAVIIPQSIAASTSTTPFITVELWDGTSAYTSAYKVNTTAATTFAAEKVYTYNIIVNTHGLSLMTTITDWDATGLSPVDVIAE